MNPDKTVSAEIVKMQVTDINQVLEILNENSLEVWSRNDFLSEIRRPDPLVLIGKTKTEVVGFCIARLITFCSNPNNIYNSKTPNNSRAENFIKAENFTDALIYPELETPGDSENIKAETECEIYNIAVKREFQNRGIGNKLLNKLVLLAKEHNSQSIWLEVRNSNTKAVKFYQKNNFRQIYERKNFYSNPLENAIVMKRNLQ